MHKTGFHGTKMQESIHKCYEFSWNVCKWIKFYVSQNHELFKLKKIWMKKKKIKKKIEEKRKKEVGEKSGRMAFDFLESKILDPFIYKKIGNTLTIQIGVHYRDVVA